MELSIIIPIAQGETAWRGLFCDLQSLTQETEILVVSSDFTELSREFSKYPNLKIRQIKSAPGRAAHLNSGAGEAYGKYLWFLHADSRFEKNTIMALEKTIGKYPAALIFFDLVFLNDASPLVKLNEWGARVRSRVFKIPFGDQGFCIRKDLFEKAGGYPEDAEYGEDHLFVWRARRCGIRLKCTGAKLYTSARKYRENGWLKTTMLYQRLWTSQAWQEWKRHRTDLAK